MRTIMRHCLPQLAVAATILFAGGSANLVDLAAAQPSHAAIPASCPYGTHWDYVTHSCV